MGDHVLAIDQGTTGTTVLVFDATGRLRARAYSEFQQYYPKPGWVEHDAEEIWQVTRKVIGLALRRAKLKPGEVAAIGITNQRETTVLWDRITGRPVHRAIVWQDRRTAEVCNGVDDNCNGVIDEGCVTCTKATAEICDRIDNDCDGIIDEGCPVGLE